ncbi:MAG TPA: hypothetical protein VK763_00215 [Terriglobales bacterium]|nr:hypothetical protein [Terriglobales bacterium]
MDAFIVSTIVLGIWAALGPLTGIFIGHWLTKRWQREQWIADNQKEEYRRLLAGLNRLNVILVQEHFNGNLDAQEIKNAAEEVTEALNTSLFITDFLTKTKVAGDVLDTVKRLGAGGSFDDYHKEYWKAINSIVAAAREG